MNVLEKFFRQHRQEIAHQILHIIVFDQYLSLTQ